MQENYRISILGRQIVDGQPEEVELTTFGQYTIKNGKRYIMYREYEEGEPASRGRTSVLKVEPGKVTMIRAGTTTRLILEKGKRHLCLYDTGYGPLTVGVFTSELHDALKQKGGSLRIKYTLDIDSNLSSKNELQVKVRPKKQDRM